MGMNSSQRKLVLVALVAAALGLHFWNLRWDYAEWPPYYRMGQPSQQFATYRWTAKPEIPEYFHGWGPQSGQPLKNHYDDHFPDWRAWGAQMWTRYELAGRPTSWEAYLRDNSRATCYFGLWRTGSDDDAWLWGIFAPLGLIGIMAFLILGWRKKPEPTPPVDGAFHPPTTSLRE